MEKIECQATSMESGTNMRVTLSSTRGTNRFPLLSLLLLLLLPATTGWMTIPLPIPYSQPPNRALPDQGVHPHESSPPRCESSHLFLPPYHRIEVPYHQQAISYWCGPACLQMLLDYYGPNIPQSDIAKVAASDPNYGTYAGDLVRAAQFSCTSTDPQGQLRGYNQRRLGYPAYSTHWTGTYTEICTSLKTLIASNTPILILTWYDDSHQTGHFRLLTGYNDTSSTFLLHDPWYSGQYHGPNQPIDQQLLINDLWNRYDKWAMIVQPWNLNITVSPLPIRPGQIVTINLTVEAPCPAPFSSTQFPLNNPHANITLPPGFTLLAGSGTVSLSFTGGEAEVSWIVQAPHILLQNQVEIGVAAGATISGTGTMTGWHTDIIGNEAAFTIEAIPGSSLLLVVAAGGTAAACTAAAVIIIVLHRRRVRSA